MTDHEFKAPERTARAVSKDGCGYNLYEPDGSDYPCDRPAVGYRWYQDVGEHEDLLDVACEFHRNAGGAANLAASLLLAENRAESAEAEVGTLRARLDAVEAKRDEFADLLARALPAVAALARVEALGDSNPDHADTCGSMLTPGAGWSTRTPSRRRRGTATNSTHGGTSTRPHDERPSDDRA